MIAKSVPENLGCGVMPKVMGYDSPQKAYDALCVASDRCGCQARLSTSEAEAVPIIRRRTRGSTVHADEARAWDALHATFEMKRIDHGQAYSANGACTNQAESYISRLRRAEIGQHHHIAGPHLGQYAGEMAWREGMRRKATGTQFNACGRLTLAHPPSGPWTGYWQRHCRKEEQRQAA